MHAKVNIANGTCATDIKLGTVEIDGMTVQCMEMDPNSSYLLSVSQLTSLGYTAIFAGTHHTTCSHTTRRTETTDDQPIEELEETYHHNTKGG